MPPRAFPFLLPLRSLQPACAPRPHYRRPLTFHHPTRNFHQTSIRRNGDASFPNHYETLECAPNAPHTDIKKQFYKLSKKHHPDLSQDSSSKGRFHQISEAYHILGNDQSRTRYDRDLARHRGVQPPPGTSASYSSSSSYAGGRAPSGLSKRRTHFRGPPPSFYRSGGYGSTSAKREGFAQTPPGGFNQYDEGHQQQQAPGTGFGPGQESNVFEEEVKHWDKVRHQARQEAILNAHLNSRKRRGWGVSEDEARDKEGGSIWPAFFMINGVLVLAVGLAGVINSGGKSDGRAIRRKAVS